jgi:hypothetical protein
MSSSESKGPLREGISASGVLPIPKRKITPGPIQSGKGPNAPAIDLGRVSYVRGGKKGGGSAAPPPQKSGLPDPMEVDSDDVTCQLPTSLGTTAMNSPIRMTHQHPNSPKKPQPPTWYFAFGAAMSPFYLRSRGIEPIDCKPGWCRDYEVHFSGPNGCALARKAQKGKEESVEVRDKSFALRDSMFSGTITSTRSGNNSASNSLPNSTPASSVPNSRCTSRSNSKSRSGEQSTSFSRR